MLYDSLSDFVTRLRNTLILKNETVLVRFSLFNCSILEILKAERFIKTFKILTLKGHFFILILLTYKYTGNSIKIRNIYLIRKSSLPIYFKTVEQLRFKINSQHLFSWFLVSTSFGVMTNRTAKKLKLGGQILFSIEL